MNAPKLERQLKDRLAAIGIEIKPRSQAARSLKDVSRVSADVVNTSEEALRVGRTALDQWIDAARRAIHDATAPASKERNTTGEKSSSAARAAKAGRPR